MKDKGKEGFSIKKRLLSFTHAFRGFIWLFRFEHNARIHLFALILVILAGFFFQITKEEWILICLVSAFVFSAEAINSSIEFLADEVTLEKKDKIGKAKDLAASAVLLAAISAIIIGFIIFIPKIVTLITK